MTRLGAVLAFMLALGALAAAHEISFSRVDVRLEPGETHLNVALPIKALLQQQPMPLPAGTTEATLRTSPLPGDVQASRPGFAPAAVFISGGDAPPVTVDRVEPAGEDFADRRRPARAWSVENSPTRFRTTRCRPSSTFRAALVSQRWIAKSDSPCSAKRPLWR